MKKINKLLLIIILLLTPIFVIAQEEQKEEITTTNKVEVYERDNTNKLGVNKKWKITDKNRNNVLNTPYVNAEQKIYDFSEIITKEEEDELKLQIDEFIKKYKMELIIVTYDLPYYEDSTNATFASDFYDYNDFGIDFEDYDGIVLFRNTYEQDPYYDMYTFGKAQLYFNQDRYDDILDSIYDDLHSSNYLTGFKLFISLTSNYIDKGIPSNMSNKYIDEMGYIKSYYVPPYLLSLLFSLIVTIVVASILVNKNKMIKKETEATHYMNKASLNYTKKQDNFITSHTTSYTVSSSSGGGGGGFSSGGSSGGGFSSGGGRHG